MTDRYPEPTWRTFDLFDEGISPKSRKLRLDVRYVVSIIERQARDVHCYQDVATIRLFDGKEYTVSDYSRRVASICAERDPAPAAGAAPLTEPQPPGGTDGH